MGQLTEVTSLLESCSLESENGFFSFSGVSEESLRTVYEVLKSSGFKGELELEGQPKKLWVNRGSDSWEQVDCPLYDSPQLLWRKFRELDRAPDFYHLFSELKPSHLEVRLELFFCWKRVLAFLADHEGTRTKPHSLIYFVSNEKSSSKFEINPLVSWDDFLLLGESADSAKIIGDIEVILKSEDVHSAERKHVMRSSLLDVLESSDVGYSFVKLVQRTKEFQRKYQERYELYVYQFSVKKLLNEIDEKTSDYLTKIQESISSSQTKAYAIPGALIGIAALVKSESFLDILLVMIGLCVIWYLTKIANDIHRESYRLLNLQMEKSFSSYEDALDENVDVKESAAEKKRIIGEMISVAVARMNRVDSLAGMMLVIALVYFVFRSYGEVLAGWLASILCTALVAILDFAFSYCCVG